MTTNDRRIIFAVFALFLPSTVLGRTAPTVRWGRQILTPTKDSIFGALVADSNGSIYISVRPPCIRWVILQVLADEEDSM